MVARLKNHHCIICFVCTYLMVDVYKSQNNYLLRCAEVNNKFNMRPLVSLSHVMRPVDCVQFYGDWSEIVQEAVIVTKPIKAIEKFDDFRLCLRLEDMREKRKDIREIWVEGNDRRIGICLSCVVMKLYAYKSQFVTSDTFKRTVGWVGFLWLDVLRNVACSLLCTVL